MKNTLLLISLLSFAAPGFANDHAAKGDPEAGKAKSTACAACHGADGNSVNPEWPKIAGQHPQYLYSSLAAYKNGERNNALMNGLAAGLSEADMRDLAAYYASMEQTPGVANPDLVPVGEALWRGGNSETGVPACSACHGPAGKGNAAAKYPRVAGQHAAYSALSLKAYRDGTRAGTASAVMMSQVATRLTDAEIEALASYMAGLH